jgi:hypothetical protein
VNANSYEFVVVNRWEIVVFQGAGLLENNVTTTIWEGEGADLEAVYLGALTLRNNCGERIYKNQDITVLLGGAKAANSIISDHLDKTFSEDENINPNKGFNIISSNDFVLFPNPNDGLFQIKTNSDCLPYSVKVLNSLGQIIYSEDNITVETFQVNLSKDIKGFIMTEIISNKKKYYNKIVIK